MTDQNKGSDMEQHTQENDNGNIQSTEINDRDSDGWSEFNPSDVAMDTTGIQYTMISSPNFVDPSEKDFCTRERNNTCKCVLEPHADELSFPQEKQPIIFEAVLYTKL